MIPHTKREYLHELVSEKNRWSRTLTDEEKKLGFLGWHERGYLPHCDFPGLVQLVTFRLRDSMPASRRGEWAHLLKIEDSRERRIKLEEYLDKGIGSCELRNSEIAQLTESVLLYFNSQRYALLAWCIMPNQVHVLLHIWQTPLSKVVQSWKRSVATGSPAILSERRSPTRRDSVSPKLSVSWQREYWDTFMRDTDQEHKAIQYIEANPVKANLCRTPGDWSFSSARYRDKFHQLSMRSERQSLTPQDKINQGAGTPMSDPSRNDHSPIRNAGLRPGAIRSTT
jgi:putative transposase